jgi:hypothetical protein
MAVYWCRNKKVCTQLDDAIKVARHTTNGCRLGYSGSSNESGAANLTTVGNKARIRVLRYKQDDAPMGEKTVSQMPAM